MHATVNWVPEVTMIYSYSYCVLLDSDFNCKCVISTDRLRPFACYACMGGVACCLIQMGYRQFCRSPKSLLYTGLVQDACVYVR